MARRSKPGQGSKYGNQSVTFGTEGDYQDAQSAIDAITAAQNNPINGVWGTNGAGGFPGSHYELDGSTGLMQGWGLPYTLPGYQLGQVNIAAQEQAPGNPGIRKAAFSTYGVAIPISIGRRAITGNVIDATDIVPVMVGTYDYWVEYQIPIYEVGPS